MKKLLGINVLEAAVERIRFTFDTFERVYVSFSGGKDSTVMLHLVMNEAIKRGRQIGVLFVDLEGQYRLTIEHIEQCCDMYESSIELHWICSPLILRNAVSQFEPRWLCWDPEREADWIRSKPKLASEIDYPFFKSGMEFEEFVPAFGDWYSNDKSTACMVGIRTDESLNRWRSIARSDKRSLDGKQWTTWVRNSVWNVYPIYDWKTADIWTWHALNPTMPYNRLYDRMHQAGMTIHQMRICQPYGDDQRKGLWLFHVVEPETWARIVARVNGANQGALYSQESGNILGRLKIDKPEGHTWESFAGFLLESMPARMREHYCNKIAVFLHWWMERGYSDGIPDEMPSRLESGVGGERVPSWRRICKSLLRNDYWCKGLSFGQTNSGSYERYRKIMRKRRERWGLF